MESSKMSTVFNIENTKLEQIFLTKDNVSLEIKSKFLCRYCQINPLNSNHYFHCNHSLSNLNLSQEIKVLTKDQEDDVLFKADMQKSLFNPELSDITFLLKNEQIPASKTILAARSPVFYKMFTGDFKEKTEKIHKIENFSAKGFKELIRYIYTGDVEDLDGNVFELLHASDFYEVEGLKVRCENKLMKMINEFNANMIFQESHRFNCCDELKKKAFTSIKKIFADQNYTLLDSAFDNPKTVNEIFFTKEKLELLINNINTNPNVKP